MKFHKVGTFVFASAVKRVLQDAETLHMFLRKRI